jgi:hypothetical protein
MADLTISSDNLAALSLDDLADRFEAIEQQGQLLQGRILLEARNRFKSDNEFGAWIENIGGAIYSASRQHRTKLMNLARFFEGRELNKIGISAAYEIAAPVNADIAVEVYEYAKGKNLPLAEVRKQIAIRKGESVSVAFTQTMQKIADISTEENELVPVRIIPTDKPLITGRPIEEEREKIENVFSPSLTSEKSKQDLIMEILAGLTGGEAKKILRDCLHLVKW